MSPQVTSVIINFDDGHAITLSSPVVTTTDPISRLLAMTDQPADRTRHRWVADDELVTLDIYVRLGQAGADHPEVVAVAELIGTTPASVNMRLGNQHAVATGGTQGLTSVAKLTKVTWEEWSHRLDELPAAAAEARARLARRD